MKSKVLITGASGFVGYHLVNAALQAGMEVHAAVRPASNIAHLEQLNLQYVYPDYTKKERLRSLLDEHQYDYIIHAAGITKARTSAEFNTVNAVYTANLASAAEQAGVPLKKFVFISSLAAIGPVGYGAAFPEPDGADPKPVTAYGKSKLQAEGYLAGMAAIPWVILRPTAVYGPREKDLFVLFKTFKRGWEPYMGRIPQQLSFIYVKDLARATIHALTGPVYRRGYNLSDGNTYDRYALADIVKRLLGVRTFRIHIPLAIVKALATVMERVGSGAPVLSRDKLHELTAPNWCCSIRQIQADMGFSPAYDLEKGMQETLEWYVQHKWF